MNRLFSNNPIYSIPRFFRDAEFEIRMAWQRVWKGYDDSWGWGLHSALSDVVPKALEQMIEYGNGAPSQFKDIKDWHVVLRKIQRGFEAANDLDDKKYMVKVKLKKPKKDMFGEMTDIGYKLDKKLESKLHREFDVGMKLLHKYYFNLWD